MYNSLKTILSILIALAVLAPAASQGQDDAALRHSADSIRKLLPALAASDKDQYVKAYFDLSMLYEESGDEKAYSSILEERIEAMRPLGGEPYASALYYRLRNFYVLNVLPEFWAEFPVYLEFCRENGFWIYYGSANDLAVCLDLEAGRFEQALERVAREYELGKTNGNDLLTAAALLGMGQTYHNMGQFDPAIAAFREAESLLITVEDTQAPIALYQLYYLMCDLLLENEKYAEALDVSGRWQACEDKFPDASSRQFDIYYVQARALGGLGRFTEAWGQLHKAEKLVHGGEVEQHMLTVARSRLYEQQGLYGQAMLTVDTLYRYYESIGGLGNQSAYKEITGRLAMKAGNYELAAASYREAIELNQELGDQKTLDELGRLRTEYEVDKITAQKEANRNYMLLALGGCVFLLAALGVWIVYSRRLAAKNRGLMQRIREQDRMEEEYARMLAALKPGETRQDEDEKQDELFTALRELMKNERLYTDTGLTRRMVADSLGTNETYLHETIRKHTGLTFNEYVNSLRLFHAREMLADPGERYTVEAVAIDSGFGTRQTFYRLFRANYGLTPEEFRKLSSM